MWSLKFLSALSLKGCKEYKWLSSSQHNIRHCCLNCDNRLIVEYHPSEPTRGVQTVKISKEWHLQMTGVCLSSCFHLFGDTFKMQALQIWVLLLNEKPLKRRLTFSVQGHGVPVPITLDHSQKAIDKSWNCTEKEQEKSHDGKEILGLLQNNYTHNLLDYLIMWGVSSSFTIKSHRLIFKAKKRQKIKTIHSIFAISLGRNHHLWTPSTNKIPTQYYSPYQIHIWSV